jgi:ANTAR domain
VASAADGRLMERFDIDAGEAFERLKRISQDAKTPIAQVAQQVSGGDSAPVKESVTAIPLPRLMIHTF